MNNTIIVSKKMHDKPNKTPGNTLPDSGNDAAVVGSLMTAPISSFAMITALPKIQADPSPDERLAASLNQLSKSLSVGNYKDADTPQNRFAPWVVNPSFIKKFGDPNPPSTDTPQRLVDTIQPASDLSKCIGMANVLKSLSVTVSACSDNGLIDLSHRPIPPVNKRDRGADAGASIKIDF